MKVLLLGDASNYHRCLSVGLSRMGHEVTVASNGSRWMSTGRDIDLSRSKGKLGGAVLWAKLNTILSSRLKGYDVVQIHNPIFLDLKPKRIKPIFDKLRRDNGGVFLTALGTDPEYVSMCIDPASPLAFNEFMVGGDPTNYVKEHPTIIDEWLAPHMTEYSKYVYDNIDGAVSALYEYHMSCLRHLDGDKVAYGGIPVDLSGLNLSGDKGSIAEEWTSPINVMLACHKGRESEKGADLMLPIMQALQKENPDKMYFDLVQDKPFAEFKSILSKAHVVVDQLYAYTPATTALMAMASGKVVVSGGAKEYYDFIGERELHPIIDVNPLNLNTLQQRLQKMLDNPEQLSKMAKEGRAFVERHNDVDVVAKRFVEFWERRSR